MKTVSIELGARSYTILIGGSLLADPDSFSGLGISSAALVVTNETVGPLYGEYLVDVLRTRHASVHTVTLPDGEQFKDWQTLNLIFEALLSQAADRKCILYALGGGVIGDMTGFAAACYMRGIDFVQVPTTLLAQVDSSVGGKTGINHPLGKNMIGAFHQPIRVVADTDVLRTLPDRDYRSGLAEVIKYGPIADREFFEWLEAHIDALNARDPSALEFAIQRSCEIKARVVASDEREGGVRAILNFGHTFGHAIEAGMGYGTWRHGEAVACGMVMAAELSVRLGLFSSTDAKRLRHLIERAGLPVTGPSMPGAEYLNRMRLDKKSEGGSVRFVVIEEMGRATLARAPDELVLAAIASCAP